MVRAGRLASVFLLLCGAAPVCLPAATITVTGTGDTVAVDGAVTLREAITSIDNGANVNADVVATGTYGVSDTIRFAIGSGAQTINVTSELPNLTVPVVIDGTTQPGFVGIPLIGIDGSAAGTANGILIRSTGFVRTAGNSTIRGLAIGRFSGAGVAIDASSNNVVAGNYLGLDIGGTSAPNGSGVQVTNVTGFSAENNLIGGVAAADRNVISGNTNAGVEIALFSSAQVEGNYIGTDPTGTLAVANHYGIVAVQSVPAIFGNVISGNAIGLQLSTLDNPFQVQGNLIGTAADGVTPLGNTGAGVVIVTSTGSAAPSIGGTTPGTGNTIAFNGGAGVSIFGANIAVLGNSIYGNAGLGIDLIEGADVTGVTPNDPCDADGGSNGLQNFPVLTSASVAGGMATLAGSLNSTSSTAFRVEFFSNITCDSSGYGQGRSYLGFANVTTDATCNASFGPFSFPVSAGQMVFTATATDPDGNTSEFSACLSTVPPTSTPTPTPPMTPTPTPTPTPSPTPTSERPHRPHTRVVPSWPAPTPTPTPTPSSRAAIAPTPSRSNENRHPASAHIEEIRPIPTRTPVPSD